MRQVVILGDLRIVVCTHTYIQRFTGYIALLVARQFSHVYEYFFHFFPVLRLTEQTV